MNFSPEMLRMAQEQMARMTPEQLADMQRMAANMDPSMAAKMGVNPAQLRQASEAMASMSPEDMAKASEQMKNMSPEDMKRQLEAASSQGSAQQQYYYNASEMLKSQGNALVKDGKFLEAEEKYRRAKTNLEADSTRAGRELRKVCMLNLSHCMLKLGRASEAAAEAGAVIAIDKRSLKGYYRRGAARLVAGELADAVADLSRAAALSPDDASVAAALADARAAAVAAGVDVSAAASDASAAVAAVVEDEADDDEPPPLINANAPPAMDAAALAKAREAMRADPSMMKNMGDMMANMSEGQIAAMSAMTPPGMPKLTPEMARQASEMFKNMSPDEMDRMMDMASKMQPGMGAAASAGRAGRGGGASGGPPGPPDMAQAMEAMKDPAAMKMVSDMMKNITPETLASMSSAAGMQMSPEDAARMAEQMQNLKPEHLEKLLAVSSALQGGLARARAVRAWVSRNSVLVAALLVLLLALLVRRWLARRSAIPAAGVAQLVHAAAGELDGLDDPKVPSW